jgi:hypothetical protein
MCVVCQADLELLVWLLLLLLLQLLSRVSTAVIACDCTCRQAGCRLSNQWHYLFV